jgi:hypothetical protein
MAFPFRMSFTGLCAFVPNTNGTEGTVLLVNAGVVTGFRHIHYPWLRYRGQKYTLANSEVTIQLTNPQPSVLQVFSPSLPPAPTPPTAQVPRPQSDDEHSIFWVADLDAAGAILQNSCFDSQKPPFVTSRIKLTAGNLSTSHLMEDQTSQASVKDLGWNLLDSSGNAAPKFNMRALATQFSLNALIDSGQVTVSSSSSTVTLALQPTAGEAVVEIGNTCDCIDDQGPLIDCGWFFDLANATTIYLPTRSPGAGVTDTMCPPARFAANPHA